MTLNKRYFMVNISPLSYYGGKEGEIEINNFRKSLISICIILVVVVAPIIIGQIIRLPFGEFTIGDEKSWVSFFGSYTGGIIGGLVAFGVAWLQINNLKTENKLNHRTYLSAATPVYHFYDVKKINRREKFRVLLTEDVTFLDGLDNKINYYSLVRFGGGEVIWDCNIEITVANDSKFTNTDIIVVWIDFFEKQEEILIPLCSKKLKNLHPFIKDITIKYRTEKNEWMKFYQSEKDMERKHYIVGKNNKLKLIDEIKVKNTSWTEK